MVEGILLIPKQARRASTSRLRPPPAAAAGARTRALLCRRPRG